MSIESQFEYQPINKAGDEIRILSLQPGPFDGPISCAISHESLHSAEDYEAVSYCWGDDSLSQRILINNASFAVTENAACALRYLRTTDRVRRVWIDAVCINQSDIGEKLHQVQRMKDIYEHASRVLAWLGPEMDGSDDGINLLRYLAQRTQEGGDIPTQPLHELPVGSLWSLLGILARPYWSRTWIVQEVSVPQKEPLFGCGRQWDSWETWKNGTSQIYAYWRSYRGPRKRDLPPQFRTMVPSLRLIYGFTDLEMIRRSFQADLSTQHRTNLLEVLKYTDSKKNSDPRDHIFALLGLIRTDNGTDLLDLITPDYSKTIRQVYCEMVKYAIVAEGNLGVLHFRNHYRNPYLPSWTPDFSKRAGRFPANAPDDHDSWSPTRRSPTSYIRPDYFPRVSDDLETLHVSGRVVSRVLRILDLAGIRSNPVKTFSRIRSFTVPMWLPGGWNSQLFSFKEAIWRTLLANRSEKNVWPCPESYCNAFDQLIMGGVKDHGKISLEFEAFLTAAYNAISFSASEPHRRLFIMADGRFGLGASECEVGDLICIVHCYSMPMILRPLGDHYEYIGDCYAHGIMNAEEVPSRHWREEWASFGIK